MCGVKLPEGLQNASKLPEPIYTPAAKAEMGEHDENITFEQTVAMVGADIAAQIRDKAIALYKAAAEIALKKGIIDLAVLRSIGVFIGTDSILGPLYFGYGKAEDGPDSFYFYLGKPL